jgi:GntR family transcriptional repressor for pyruvate dehydrogenase complex
MRDMADIFGTPIPRRVLAEHLAQLILEQIREGNLLPGQQLPPERELATTLGVSRPSLREALRALSILGILDKRHGEGVFVTELSPEALYGPLHFLVSLESHHLDSLIEARIFVEPGLAALAAERMDADAGERLKSCLARNEASLADVDSYIESDLEFHRMIAGAAANPFLDQIARSLLILVKAGAEVTLGIPNVRLQSFEDHKKIVDALIDGDPDRASEAMRLHLRNVQKVYYEQKQEQTQAAKTHSGGPTAV